jgi:hypothetical protein
MLGGVHMSPDGNNKRTLIKETYGRHYTILFLFSMCYLLPIVTLTEKECTHIMAPVNKVGLSLSGISSTISTAVRVGPYKIGGLGILHPHLYMGVSMITAFLTNTWLQTPTGLLMVELGLSTLLTVPKFKGGLQYATTPSRIRHILSFAVEHDIHIALPTSLTLTAKRQLDRTIIWK